MRGPESYFENCVGRVMTVDGRSPEILITVCSEQIGMALVLFRAAVFDETGEKAILPLSDRGIRNALLEAEVPQRGIGVIRIYFDLATVFL